MYNGIGLQTPRGSGTNGHVQRNLSYIKLSKERVEVRDDGLEKLEKMLSRKANEEILDHERKRQVEIKCLELDEQLREQGYESEEVEGKVRAFREEMLSTSLDKVLKGISATTRANVTETHAVAEATAAKNEAFRQAMGLKPPADDETGGDQEEDTAAAAAAAGQQDDEPVKSKSGKKSSKRAAAAEEEESKREAKEEEERKKKKKRSSNKSSDRKKRASGRKSSSSDEPELSDEPDSPSRHGKHSSSHKHSSRKQRRSRSRSRDRKHNKHSSSHRSRKRRLKKQLKRKKRLRGTGNSKKVGVGSAHSPADVPPHILVLGTVIYGEDYTAVPPPASFAPSGCEWDHDFFWHPATHAHRWHRTLRAQYRALKAARKAHKRAKRESRAGAAEAESTQETTKKDVKPDEPVKCNAAVPKPPKPTHAPPTANPPEETEEPPVRVSAGGVKLHPLPPLSPPATPPAPAPPVSPPPRRKRTSPHFSERRRITSARKKPVFYDVSESLCDVASWSSSSPSSSSDSSG